MAACLAGAESAGGLESSDNWAFALHAFFSLFLSFPAMTMMIMIAMIMMRMMMEWAGAVLFEAEEDGGLARVMRTSNIFD